MKIPLESVKELRQITSASVSDCKNALQETKGDVKKAIELLRKRGLEIAAKSHGQQSKEGRIEAYVHHDNKVGALVEINCQTDFVARNSEFCRFCKDVAMQITACNPLYIKREDVSAAVIAEEKDKEKFYKENCLLEQPFIKDLSITIKDCLGSLIAKMGENIVIRRFVRYKVGE